MKKIQLSFTAIFIVTSSFAQWSSNSNGIYYNGGNVGIGTINPSGNLHLNSSSPSLYLTGITSAAIRGNGGTWLFGYGGTPGNEDIAIGTANPGDRTISMFAGGENRLKVLANGNVGIGTTNPEEKLHINSDLPTHLLVSGQQAKAYFRINNEDILLLTGSYTKTLGSHYTFLQNQLAGSAILYSTGVDLERMLLGSKSNVPLILGTNDQERMRIDENGNIGIGTPTPDAKLTVKGDIHTQEVTVDLQGAVAPDFVFEEDYELRTLEETEEYVQANKHLPEIPSATEMEENGFELKEMNLKLLQKVEELTLHLIEQNKINKAQEDRIAKLERKLDGGK